VRACRASRLRTARIAVVHRARSLRAETIAQIEVDYVVRPQRTRFHKSQRGLVGDTGEVVTDDIRHRVDTRQTADLVKRDIQLGLRLARRLCATDKSEEAQIDLMRLANRCMEMTKIKKINTRQPKVLEHSANRRRVSDHADDLGAPLVMADVLLARPMPRQKRLGRRWHGRLIGHHLNNVVRVLFFTGYLVVHHSPGASRIS